MDSSFTCPYCGATQTDDASNRCHQCGRTHSQPPAATESPKLNVFVIAGRLAWLTPLICGAALLLIELSALTDRLPQLIVIGLRITAVAGGAIAALVAVVGALAGNRRKLLLPSAVGCLLSAVILVVLLVTGAATFWDQIQQPNPYRSSDRRWQVAVPSYWQKPVAPRPDATLHLSAHDQSEMFLILSAPLTEGEQITLTDRAAEVSSELADQHSLQGLAGPTETAVDGIPALRFDYRLRDAGKTVVMIHILLQVNGSLDQILLSTEQRLFRQQPELYEQILGSLDYQGTPS